MINDMTFLLLYLAFFLFIVHPLFFADEIKHNENIGTAQSSYPLAKLGPTSGFNLLLGRIVKFLLNGPFEEAPELGKQKSLEWTQRTKETVRVNALTTSLSSACKVAWYDPHGHTMHTVLELLYGEEQRTIPLRAHFTQPMPGNDPTEIAERSLQLSEFKFCGEQFDPQDFPVGSIAGTLLSTLNWKLRDVG